MVENALAVAAMAAQESVWENTRRTVTAADIMELQEAAARLRSQCALKETENRRLTAMLHDCNQVLICLHAKELLLQKEVSLWSAFYHRFVQPLYDSRLALGRYCSEVQHLAIQEMLFHQEQKSLLTKATTENRLRENATLLSQVRGFQEQRDVWREQQAAAEVRLKNALEERRETQQQANLLKDDLAFCMSRLEESERERKRVERHLSQHEAALAKRAHVTVDKACYEEIRLRDEVISKLQLTIRELNALLAGRLSSGLEDVGSGESAHGKHRSGTLLQESAPLVSPFSLQHGDSCYSDRPQKNIQQLHMQLGNDANAPTDSRRLFPHYTTTSSPLTPLPPSSSSLSVPTLVSGSGGSMSADLQRFLAQELRAPCP